MIRLAKFIATCNKRYAYQVDYTNCNQKGHNYLSLLHYIVFDFFGFCSTFLPLWTLKMKQVRELCQVVTFFTCDKSFWGKTVGTKSQDCLTQYFPAIN